jgi:two-component system response regulator (stage 0 sporulation protein F)
VQNKSNILLVDDEYSVSFSLINILVMEHYKVTSSNNGKDAIETVKNSNFGMAFFDIRLPDMTGVELLRAVRDFNSSLIIIMMTAYAKNNLIEEALQEGAVTCLRKPFEISEVLGLVKKLIK